MCEQIVCYVTPDSGSDKPSAAEILKWMKDLNDWFSVGEKVGGTVLSRSVLLLY